jgi:shikimate dehydrogenase
MSADATRRVLTLDQVASWQGPPLIVFVGVHTGGSLVHTVFDRWASLLDRPWTLRGVDLPADAPPQRYLRLLAAMRGNPAVHGAIVTAHKLRLYRACAPDLARRDRLVDLTHEVNTLTADTTVAAYARDALSLAQILPALIQRSAAQSLSDLYVLCLGAGGAGTALLLALHLDIHAATGATPRLDRPASVVFADHNPRALDDLRAVSARAGLDPTRLSFAQVRGPDDGDRLVAGLASPALVVNATGLGKDAPGSPVSDRAPFGPATLAWDLNYRGTLTFLRQAADHGARTVDGWAYFVAGWAGGLTAIAGSPFTSDLLTRFARAAAPYRPQGASPRCPAR